jgi:hypothetical protein
VTGKGDGPVIRSLIKSPPDLTKLSEANHGVFAFSHVYDVIDGRIEVISHGTRDMPVWGEVYRREVGSQQNGMVSNFLAKEVAGSIVRARILALIEYISTLQRQVVPKPLAGVRSACTLAKPVYCTMEDFWALELGGGTRHSRRGLRKDKLKRATKLHAALGPAGAISTGTPPRSREALASGHLR